MKKRQVKKTAQRKDRRNIWVVLALFAALLLTYANSFVAGFVLDNKAIILDDPRIQTVSSKNIGDIFHHTYWWPLGESGLYRPLTTLSYLLNYSVLGNEQQPQGYHWVNLLLHLINAVLLYFLVLRITSNFRVASFSAMLWSVHPVLTESVTNIVGRADLLAATGVMGGLLIYLKLSEVYSWRRIACLTGLALVTAIGVFSKESAIVIVGVIALFEFTWWKERSSSRGWILAAGAALLIPIEIFLYERSFVLAASPPGEFPFYDNPINGATFWTGRLTAVKVMAHYLGLIAWPGRLSSDYSYNQIPLSSGTAGDWAAWTVIALITAIVVFLFKRNREVFFLACMAFLTILPASNILFPAGTIMAERLVYLPSAAVLTCVVIGLEAAGSRFWSQKATALVVCVMALAFACRTWARNQDWLDDLTLARSTVSASPHSFKAHQMLAEALFQSDPEHRDVDAVLTEAERGIVILNTLPDVRNNPELYRLAGACYILKGDRLRPKPESVQWFQKALPLLQHGANILEALRAERRRQLKMAGQPDEAVAPASNDDIYRLLSIAYLRLGDGDKAFESIVSGRNHNPLNPEVYSQMSDVLESVGESEQAAEALIQGMLVTSNMALRKQLIELYGRGLDPNHCAVVPGPYGPKINAFCGMVHKEVCDVAADAVNISLSVGHKEAARLLRASLLQEYRCPVTALDKVPRN